MSRSRPPLPAVGDLAAAARRGVSAARSSYTQRRGRADHLGLAIALRATLGPSDDAIDVGAHIGEVTSQILTSAPRGRVLAVEPLPHLAADLRRTMPSNVIVEEVALVDEAPEQLEFLHVRNNPGYSGLRERDYPDEPEIERITVKTARLDDLVERHDLRPRVIKIDVEGAELGVLRGARRTILTHKPVILVEHGTAAEGYGESPDTLFDLTEDLGLRIFDFDGYGPYSRAGFNAAVSPEGYFNFLLRP